MIELRLLRYFLAVAETEHVGRAAARLHISQSPLSRQIRQLEDILGVRLFHRDRQRIRITDAGRWLLAPAREMVARAEALVGEAHAVATGEVGKISIGFVGAALASGVLPAALRRLRAERPRVRIGLRQLASREQLARLRARALDVALVHQPPRTVDLVEHRLLDQPYVLAVPRPGPLARGSIRPTALAGQTWIVVASGEEDRERWTSAWNAAGVAPSEVIQVVEWTSALALVDAGVGIALVPASYAAPASPRVALRPVPWLRTSSQLSLVRRRGETAPLTDAIAGWIIEAARSPRTRTKATSGQTRTAAPARARASTKRARRGARLAAGQPSAPRTRGDRASSAKAARRSPASNRTSTARQANSRKLQPTTPRASSRRTDTATPRGRGVRRSARPR